MDIEEFAAAASYAGLRLLLQSRELVLLLLVLRAAVDRPARPEPQLLVPHNSLGFLNK